MPICIECSYPVSHLYSTYSRADDRSLGKGVRLTQCPRCQRFADKYVEYDFVVIFIDLVLIKPQVYRHLLFNRLGGDDNQFDRSIVRLGVLLLLFDVYLTWARIEKTQTLSTTFLARAPIVIQYFFFLGLNTLATLAHHLTIRLLASILAPVPRGLEQNGQSSGNSTTDTPSHPSTPVFPSFPAQAAGAQSQLSPTSTSALSPPRLHSQSSAVDGSSTNGASAATSTGDNTPTPNSNPPPPAHYAHPPPPLRRASTAPTQNIQPLPPPSPASPTAISTALLVSSCVKLFPILLVIWGPDGGGSSSNNNNASESSHALALETSQFTPSPNFPTQALNSLTPSATTASSGTSESPTLLESLVHLMPTSIPTNYLANVIELVGSLLSLGAADTHLVLLSNIEALYILLGCGYLRAMALAVTGLLARWTVQKVILGVVGVG
ncbi:sterol homeostasis protein ARV1 [Aspergillus affinis]|uniref:sterol homeostasis protein ARV1 n=1 Tax=Aspergillus affinis TaxID=1070780 RepID=UPI0022FDE056|nr:uncharacterized protein KD926_007135 [Aspergillus affinis]KAI9045832.1 hypothetical protein KD926_007135 [Aspergillus affinis]